MHVDENGGRIEGRFACRDLCLGSYKRPVEREGRASVRVPHPYVFVYAQL